MELVLLQIIQPIHLQVSSILFCNGIFVCFIYLSGSVRSGFKPCWFHCFFPVTLSWVTFVLDLDFILAGYYMYIETSSPRKPYDKARLESEEFQPTGSSGRCLKFWYHMYGSDIGTLNIWMSSNGTSGQIWSLSGDQGNKWLYGQAPVSSKDVYQVSKEAHFHRRLLVFVRVQRSIRKIFLLSSFIEGLSVIAKEASNRI